MAVQNIPLDFLLSQRLTLPMLDVRSEGEFASGHIPEAYNLPILNNEERRQVGICYKGKGNKAAVLLGYELVAHKFKDYIKEVFEIAPQKKVFVYCWRGGLRSSILADLLKNAGFTVYRLKGGYKTYRTWALAQLTTRKNIQVLGGATGSQKTSLLYWLALQGHQVIDLEGLANHRGSAFGHIGLGNQPSHEQFENRLALEWSKTNPMKPLWLEDESRMIGKLNLPKAIYEQIRESTLYKLDIPAEERKEYILQTYGRMPMEELAAATEKLKRRLGDENFRLAIECLETGDKKGWLDFVMAYYDKTYLHGNEKRDKENTTLLDKPAFLEKYKSTTPLHSVFLLLGGNVGEREWMLQQAEKLIGQQVGRLIKKSNRYATKAWGNTEQPDFLNQVLLIGTRLSAQEVLEKVLAIEQQLGRRRHEKWSPRTIDIDILFYEHEVVESEGLTLPHPHLHERRFTLIPLAEITPLFQHPVMKKTMLELLDECGDGLEVNLHQIA